MQDQNDWHEAAGDKVPTGLASHLEAIFRVGKKPSSPIFVPLRLIVSHR